MATIVVEGPIGVGKTSLARYLAEELRARLLLEAVEENPFLADFYRDPARYAFPTETFFLLSRFRQHSDIVQDGLFQRHTVADYLFDKTYLFASLNLSGDEFELYRGLFEQLRSRLPDPDLVVYLRAQPALLLERIAKRGRDFEAPIDADYLERIGAAYDDYFARAPFPVHVVEASTLDFVADSEARTALTAEILSQAHAA
ncbi:MAG: deoxynucleoside kinase [Trueperaceae bacterium]